MSTRYLVAVHLNGVYPFAEGGDSDGYPEGRGLELLRFLKECSWKRLAKRCSRVYTTRRVVNPVSNADLAMNAVLSLKEVYTLKEQRFEMANYLTFAADSLFCEWAYVVDLDAKALEVYRGFNMDPLPEQERFAVLPRFRRDYYPVKLVAKWGKKDLPKKKVFFEQCKGPL